MDSSRRRELREQYKEVKTMMGVYKITNIRTGRILVASANNLKNKWESIKMRLAIGQHVSAALNADWKSFGADAFEYEILEQTETDKVSDIPYELRQMEKKWLERLCPYDEAGYNKR